MDRRIGFSPRLGALLIDLVLAGGGALVLGPLLGGLIGVAVSQGTSQPDPLASGLLGAIMGSLLVAGPFFTLYFFLEAFTGFTLGKLLLGQRVRAQDGQPAPIPRLLLRCACKHPALLLGLLASLSGLDALGTLGRVLGALAFLGCFAALGGTRLALHDLIARTAVYPKEAAKLAQPPGGLAAG